MAFPTIQGTPSQGSTAVSALSITCTQPAGVTAGEGLLAFVSYDDTGTFSTTTTGWVELGDATDGTATVRAAVFWKASAVGGGDATDTLVANNSVSERGSYIVYRISGHSTGNTPDITSSTGSSTNSNPPALTPAAGAKDYLWFASRHGDLLVVATAPPTLYANHISQAGATSGASTNAAARPLNNTVEDPGVFTSATEQWVCFTVAVHPAATATTVALRGDLGTTAASASSTTIAHTTIGGVPAGSRIILDVSSFSAGTISSASGGGLTWAIDAQGSPSGDRLSGLISADAPSGLVSGTAITVTFSAAMTDRGIGVSSWGGIKTGASGYIGVSGSVLTAAGSWSTGAQSISAGSLLIGVAHEDGAGTRATPAAGVTELHDFTISATDDHASAYRIETSAGSYTVSETWTSSSENSVAYAEYTKVATSSFIAKPNRTINQAVNRAGTY